MGIITSEDVRANLKRSSDKNISELADNSEVVKDLAFILIASVEIAEEFPRSKAEIATVATKKLLSISSMAATASESKGLSAANLVAGQALKTIGLLKVANLTPARASMYITLTMAEKVVSAAGMGNIDKCKMAIASLSATTGMSGFVCVGTGTWTFGVGCIAGAIAVAAEAFNVYGQCRNK